VRSDVRRARARRARSAVLARSHRYRPRRALRALARGSRMDSLIGMRRVDPGPPARRAPVDSLPVQVGMRRNGPLLARVRLDLGDALQFAQRNSDLRPTYSLDDEHPSSLVSLRSAGGVPEPTIFGIAFVSIRNAVVAFFTSLRTCPRWGEGRKSRATAQRSFPSMVLLGQRHLRAGARCESESFGR